MGLAYRVIPTMLVRGEHLVKGRQFNSWRVVGHAMQAARIHAARAVDELILLDISATPEGRGPNLAFIEELSERCTTPLTVGGGVRSVEDVYQVLRAGADKVAICTNHHIISECAARFGTQAIVAAIDERDGLAWTHAGTEHHPSHYVANFAKHLEQQGAGEILLTSIEREGTMQGYDLPLISAVANVVSIPVIAHGGCSGPEDMLAAIKAGASACAAGALFQFTEQTPYTCACYLEEQGVEVRIEKKHS